MFLEDKKIFLGRILGMLFYFFLFVSIVTSTFFITRLHVNSMENFQASAYDAVQQSQGSNEPEQVNVLLSVREKNSQLESIEDEASNDINVKSAFSIEFNQDGEGKVLYGRNSAERLPVASLVKLMTALIVLENYNLNQEVAISKLAMEEEGEQGSLEEGQILSVKDLLYITLIESSNKAAFALSEIIGNEHFIVLMNRRAKELSLFNTYFADSTGLSELSYSSARDIATLSEYLFLTYPLFSEIIGLKEFELYLLDGSLHHELINTNELLGQYEIVGGKTGYTTAAKGCFMVIQENASKSYTIHVILGAEDRFLEMQKLINQSIYSLPNT